MSNPLANGVETDQQRFERILSQPLFEGLKAILERASPDKAILYSGAKDLNAYEELLARLGYKVVLTKQIHLQDCYSRVGAGGTIKAVLSYHDVPSQSSLPTLLNFDHTVTTTPKAAAFFGRLFAELKKQMSAPA